MRARREDRLRIRRPGTSRSSPALTGQRRRRTRWLGDSGRRSSGGAARPCGASRRAATSARNCGIRLRHANLDNDASVPREFESGGPPRTLRSPPVALSLVFVPSRIVPRAGTLACFLGPAREASRREARTRQDGHALLIAWAAASGGEATMNVASRASRLQRNCMLAGRRLRGPACPRPGRFVAPFVSVVHRASHRSAQAS